jgi:hypothetical protein
MYRQNWQFLFFQTIEEAFGRKDETRGHNADDAIRTGESHNGA